MTTPRHAFEGAPAFRREQIAPSVEEAVPQAPIEVPPPVKEQVQEAIPGGDRALERLNRDLEVAHIVGRLEAGESLKEGERKALKGVLENRSWHKLLARLQPGDKIAAFLVPSGETFSIKNLNDNIFGMQKTDDLIKYRRDVLSARLSEVELEELAQSFREGFFRVPPEQQSPDLEVRLRAVAERVNADVSAKINQMLDEEGEGADADHKAQIDDFRVKLNHPEHGYRIAFGLENVGVQSPEGSYAHIERAVGNGLKAAMMARMDGRAGGAFQPEHAESFVRGIAELRGRIESTSSNAIHDTRGRTFSLFQKTESGQQLNLDVMREIRKGTLEPASRQEQTFGLLKEYLARINILDIVKPFTHEELSGGTLHGTELTLQEDLHQIDHHIQALETDAPMSDVDRVAIAHAIRTEGKDRECTSAVEFHARALRMADCAYVSLDVLDVGLGLLQEFEHLIQEVEQGRMTFEEASATAGDQTTSMMRAFRMMILQVVRRKTGIEVPAMLVGGDEATLALDASLVTDELLLTLQKETRSRVVKTVVARADRSSDLSDPEAVKREHLIAKQRAEDGAAAAKEIEVALRDLRRKRDALPPGPKEVFSERLADLRLDHFAILERPESGPGAFDVMTEAGESWTRAPLEEYRKRLHELHQLATDG